jgi:hypothetical protein
MKKNSISFLLVGLFTLSALSPARAQKSLLDSLFMNADTTAVLDSLMEDFDDYLDSISKRRSMFFIGIGAGTGFFSFENKNSVYLSNERKLIVSPSLGYYHKSGFGISANAYGMSDNGKFIFYQYAVSPSYDHLSRAISTGVAYAHYFNKDSLDFYTTPIHDEIFTYFSYKKWWVRPTISLSYGWGSNTEYEKQKYRIWSRQLQQVQDYYITIKNVESVRDFSLTLSVRKDFDWYDVLGKNDNFTLTPVLLLYSGTQQFGFNTSYSYTFNTVRVNSLPSNNSASDKTKFAPQSAGAIIRASYMKGKFLLQPQVLFDYYLQETDNNPFNTVFSINVSLAF